MTFDKLQQLILVGRAYNDLYNGQCIAIRNDLGMCVMIAIGENKEPLLFQLQVCTAMQLKPIKRKNVSKKLIALYHSLEITNEIKEGDLLLFATCFGLVIKNKRVIYFRKKDFRDTFGNGNYMSYPNASNISKPFYKITGEIRENILKASYKIATSSNYILSKIDENECERFFDFEDRYCLSRDYHNLRKVLNHNFIKYYKQLKEQKRTIPRISLWHRIKRLLIHDGIVWTK